MTLAITLLYILFVAAAIILTVVILLQEGKGGGFGDALGTAGQQAFGVKASGVQRFTAYVAIAFLVSAVLIHILNNRRQNSSSLSEEGAAPYVSVEEVGGTELR
ncbi:MAG: preprotein translocase subunit SecG [Planctomycetota bacterium]|jgi:preprotein translocase subunit SecG